MFTLGSDIGELDNKFVPAPKFRPSPSPCSEASLEYNPTRCRDLLQDQLFSLPDWWMGLNHSSELLPNPQSKLRSQCLSQHSRTSNETVNTGVGPSSVDREDLIPSPSIEAKTEDFLELWNKQSIEKVLKLEDTENQSTRKWSKTARKNEDQISLAPTAQCPWALKLGEYSNREESWIKQNVSSNSGSRCPRDKWLSCPWYKKDPLKYSGCAKYKLLRIKDVKQHINRRHMKPSVYCDVCFEVFPRDAERISHIQKRSCTRKVNSELDGLSEKQRRRLNQNANHGKNDVERWYYMWDTIFPGEQKPLSPYLSSGRQELLPLLRSFWNKKHQQIIRKVLQESQRELEPETIQNIMDAIFDRFEAESLHQECDTNEHFGDESSEASDSKRQSPNASNCTTQDDLPSQQNISDYGMLCEPTEQQPRQEFNCASEYMSRCDPNMFFGFGFERNLAPYSLRYSL
ncbi:hypothetical protein F4774DRAFT_113949 [Daldinia eschscholtzii]|nr:hypothetical protein F4774DRAFT_113949 [Daldinia eschscholtzii]